MLSMRKVVNVLILIVLLLGIGTTALAKVATTMDAMEVAKNFIEYLIKVDGSWGGAKDAYVLECVKIKRNGSFLGYFLPVEPQGFIVVSPITQLPPVKAYSTTSNLNINDRGGMAALIKDTIEADIKILEEQYTDLDSVPQTVTTTSPRNFDAWEWLLGHRSEPMAEHDVINGPLLQTDWSEYELSRFVGDGDIGSSMTSNFGPLLSTTWGQCSVYNDYCPIGDTSCTSCGGGSPCETTTLVGCVATAAAQIMKYWNYPYSGTGSHSYTWNGDDSCGHSGSSQTLSADFSDSYDWENMLNSYSGSYTEAQRQAVAELCYEVGVAFEMDYGVCGSGAYTGRAVDVFPTYFKYANTTQKKNRSDYTPSDAWFREIRKEFDNALPRPLQYKIGKSDWGGHSIVCDGYRISGGVNYVHLNYGWYGSYDAWYAIDNIQCGTAGTCDSDIEYAVFGIQPRNRIYMRVKGAHGNNIYGKWMDHNENWRSTWLSISGQTTHAPSMVTFMNRLYIAVKGGNSNTVYIKYKDYKASWSSWTTIPNGATDRTPALAVFNNRLYVAVKGAHSNNVYINYMDTSGTWNGWSQVPGVKTDDSPALAGAGDYLYLGVKGISGKFYVNAMDINGNWAGTSAWPPNGYTTCAPALAPFGYSDSYPQVAIALRGRSGDVYRSYVYYNGSSYVCPNYYWEKVPNGRTSTSPSLSPMPQLGKLYLAVKGASSNNIYYTSTSDSYSGGWASWQQVPGQTNDTPTIWVHYYYNPSN